VGSSLLFGIIYLRGIKHLEIWRKGDQRTQNKKTNFNASSTISDYTGATVYFIAHLRKDLKRRYEKWNVI